MTLSIIIPTFQAGAYLDRALQSIVAQSFNDLEVLIMDGASTDGTAAIAAVYARDYPFIHFFSEADAGIYDAMNKGIERAKGEWIYFLGADDTLYNNDVLGEVFSQSDVANADVMYGQVFLSQTKQLYLGEFDAEKLIFRNISHQAIFTRKAVFQHLGLYDLKYKICADHIFNVRWFFDSAIRKKYIGVVVATFNAGGVSTSKNDWDKIRDLPHVVCTYGGWPAYIRYYKIRPWQLRAKKLINNAKNGFYTLFK